MRTATSSAWFKYAGTYKSAQAKLRARGLSHPVSDPDLCQDILRLRRIFFQLAPDIGHIDPQDAVVVRIRKRPPYMRDNRIIGNDTAAVLGEKDNDFVFDLRQMNGFAVERNLAAFKINGQAVAAKRLWFAAVFGQKRMAAVA